MLDTLVSSKTKLKILLKFFLNISNTAYLRNLETEFGESTNAIRLELNKFEESGFLISHASKNKKIYQVNTSHPLFPEINSIIKKYIGIDSIIEQVLQKLGSPTKIYLLGQLAKGLDDSKIEIGMCGNINIPFIESLKNKLNKDLKKEINICVLNVEELIRIESNLVPNLLLWEENNF